MRKKMTGKRNKEAKVHHEVNEPGGLYQPSEPLSFEKVWLMFQETDKKFQETDKKFQETDKEIMATSKEVKETARLIRELREEYKNRWGELIKSLVSGNLLRL